MTSVALTDDRGSSRFLSGSQLDVANSAAFVRVVFGLILLIGVAGMSASFPALAAVAEWALLDGWRVWIVPVVIEGVIIAFSLAAAWLRSRGQSMKLQWAFVTTFTMISVVANMAHVLIETYADEGLVSLTAVIGASVAGLMPISIWLVTHVLIDLFVLKPTATPEELRLQHEKQYEERKAAEAARQQRLRAEQLQAEQREMQLQEVAASDADWDRIRNHPESGNAGTPEREALLKRVERSYGENGNNMTKVAEELGIGYGRVRTAVEALEARKPVADDDNETGR